MKKRKGMLFLGLFFTFICLALFMCTTTGRVSDAENNNLGVKRALVIGNANYQNILRLQNPRNDAEDVANVLKQIGFNVELYFDMTHHQMETAINRFIEQLSGNKDIEGLIYFAGQGFSINGQNYIVPVDLNASGSAQIITGSYAMETLLNKLLGANNTLNIVIIDACFTKMTLPHFHAHRGVVFFPMEDQEGQPVESDGLELLNQFTNDIFYLQSALPGRTALDGAGGRNSPFARALIKNLANPVRFMDLVKDIMTDTLEYTNRQQHPYFKGNIFIHEEYIINQGV